MLNEKLEYLEYTLRTKKVFRFARKRELLSLTGLRRGLEIIAREIYYKNNECNFDKTVNALYAWFGLQLPNNEFNDDKDIQKLSGYLNEYYAKEFFDSKIDQDKFIKKIETKQNTFDYAIFKESVFDPVFNQKATGNTNRSINDLRAFSTYDIVSKAIEDGPLKVYYLVSDDRYALNSVISIDKKPIIDKREDYVLKEITTHLLARKYDNQEYVFFRRIDLQNWCKNTTEKPTYEPRSYNYMNNGNVEPFVYTKELIKNANYYTYKVHPELIKHFAIIEEDQLKDVIDKIDCIYVDTATEDLLLKKIIATGRDYKDIKKELDQINDDSKKFLTLK